jgi:hypothetical protein
MQLGGFLERTMTHAIGFFFLMFPPSAILVSSHRYICYICVIILPFMLYMCPHTAIHAVYVSTYWY